VAVRQANVFGGAIKVGSITYTQEAGNEERMPAHGGVTWKTKRGDTNSPVHPQ
jgi:hypothetical protein